MQTNLIREMSERYPKVLQEFAEYITGKNKLLRESCFCNWENFFEENKVIINCSYDSIIKKGIFEIRHNDITYYEHNFFSKNEAKYQSILKASKILKEKTI